MATKKKLDFEQSMVRLEEIVGLLGAGGRPAGAGQILFEEGAGILRQCSALLDQAEQKVTLLTGGTGRSAGGAALRRGALSMEQEVFQQRLEEDRKLVEEALHQVCQGWRRYADLTEAMEYSLLAGGKRIRPVLVLETCRLCGGDPALGAAPGLRCGDDPYLLPDPRRSCPPWMTMTCGGGAQPTIRCMERPPPSWPATGCSQRPLGS